MIYWKLFIERIKFSFLRDYYYLFIFYFSKISNNLIKKRFLWNIKFKKVEKKEPKGKTLLFFPSMSMGKSSFLDIGIRSFIESSKKENIEIDLLQCFGGLDLCHLGGSPFSAKTAMPCKSCKLINSEIYSDLNIIKFPEIQINRKDSLDSLTLNELMSFKYKNIEIGNLLTSTIIWIRRTSIIDDSFKPYFIKGIDSSMKLINFLESFDLESYDSVLVFNGLSYPESILYKICKNKKIKVATFEGGLDESSAYSIEYNYGYTPQHFFNFRDIRKNNSGEKRTKKNFPTAKLDNLNLYKNIEDKKIISIFGNVSWDTSQFISNDLYKNMFQWLESLIPIIHKHKEYYFIFRPHPGESRKVKNTWYGLENWYSEYLEKTPNTLCIGRDEVFDSYDLIYRSSLVLVYNSTIGIEAVSRGRKTLTAAKSHYSNIGFIKNLKNTESYLLEIEKILMQKDFSVNKEDIQLANKYLHALRNNVSYNLDNFVQSDKNQKISVKNIELLGEDLEIRNLVNSLQKEVSLERFFNKP